MRSPHSDGAAESQADVQASARARALPPVLCAVLHTGPRPEHTPRRLHDLMTALSALGPLAAHVPAVTLSVDDLAAQSMDALEARMLDPTGRARAHPRLEEPGPILCRFDGQRPLLENQLRRKFGDLDAPTHAWLQAADEPAPQTASERFLTASTLAETLALS